MVSPHVRRIGTCETPATTERSVAGKQESSYVKQGKHQDIHDFCTVVRCVTANTQTYNTHYYIQLPPAHTVLLAAA